MPSLTDLRSLEQLLEHQADGKSLGIAFFEPRPDNPAEGDEQASFVNSRDKVAFFLKGNAAGGTESAAFKTALYLLQQQPPPVKDTPFWIISNSYTQCIDVCWKEKLHGHGYIPDCEVDWNRVIYHSAAADRPVWVPLKPWPESAGGHPGKNWVIEFKSYEQGRSQMQSKAIGGFWFSEQFPWQIFTEVLRGCRQWMYPGGQFAEFTPIDPDLCDAMQRILDHPKPGWRVYRGNTACNTRNLAEGFLDDFTAAIPDELLDTRLRGDLAGFQGVIYQSFSPQIHVVEDEWDERLPFRFDEPAMRHGRGIDWGESEQHYHVCLWGCRSLSQDWLIYDEYSTNDQGKITSDHAIEIVARSIAWGWPVPPVVVNGALSDPRDRQQHTEATQDKPTKRQIWLAGEVFKRLGQLDGAALERVNRWLHGEEAEDRIRRYTLTNEQQKYQQHFGGMDYADHRPGEISEFNSSGIPCGLASKADVYGGINCVREMLKVNPYTGRPRLFIAKRCRRLLAGMKRYRWDESGERKKLNQPKPLKKEDDEVDCARYLLFSATKRGDTTVPDSIPSKQLTRPQKRVPLDRSVGVRRR